TYWRILYNMHDYGTLTARIKDPKSKEVRNMHPDVINYWTTNEVRTEHNT
ncbi:unnamed protein product, partial [marine sediment metagenome]